MSNNNDNDDSSELSKCEQGTEGTGASITQEGSFLSSFSQDETAVDFILPHHHENFLRHRAAVNWEPASEDLHLLQEEGDLNSYSDDEEGYDFRGDDDDHSDDSKNHPPAIRGMLHFRWRKLKLIVITGMALLLAVHTLRTIALLAIHGRRWKLPSPHKRQKIIKQLGEQPITQGLTVRLRGNHVDLLHRLYSHISRCPDVTHVQFDWTDHDIPESILALEENTTNNNNYYYSMVLSSQQPPSTSAMLLLDEESFISCDDVHRALQEWRLDPSQLVGLVPSLNAPVSEAAVVVHRFYWQSLMAENNNHKLLSDTLPDCSVALVAWVTALVQTSPVAVLSNTLHPTNPVSQSCLQRALYLAGLSEWPKSGDAVIIGGMS